MVPQVCFDKLVEMHVFLSNNFQLMAVKFLLQTQIMVQYLIPSRLSLKILTALDSICNVSASDCSRKIRFHVSSTRADCALKTFREN